MVGMSLARSCACVAGLWTIAAVSASCHNESIPFTKQAEVSGHWAITANDVSGGGLTCNVAGLTVALIQTDTTFTGTVLAGTITCVQGIFTGTRPADIGSTVSGTVVTRDIAINDTAIGASLTGTVDNGDMVMSGTCSVQLTLGDGSVVTVTGPWSGQRTGG